MKLNQRLIGKLAGIAVMVFTAADAFGVVLGDAGTGNNWIGAHQSGSGGEFYFQTVTGPVNNSSYNAATKNQGGITNSFQTFCLEYSEWLGGSNLNYVVNDEAVGGGVNNHVPAGDQGGDILSVGTAWLYSQFATASLVGYNFGTTSARKDTAALLQNAIWALEDEIADPVGNTFFDAAVTHFGGSALAQANSTTGQFGVWVLNNTSGTVKKQDMLFYAGAASVPDGGSTLILLGVSLAGVSLLARYRNKQASDAV